MDWEGKHPGICGTALGEDYEFCDDSSSRGSGSSNSSGRRRRTSYLDYICCSYFGNWCRFSWRAGRCYCCKMPVRCTIIKLGACCWMTILLAFNITLLVFMYFLYGNQGSNAYNPQLIRNLINYDADGLRFTDVCRFKQWTGTRHFDNPNILGMIHHEGVLLNTMTADGYRKGVLQLDFGHFGASFSVHVDWHPVRLYGKSHLDWRGENCQYECGKIPLYQKPGSLVEMIEAYKGWSYNVFWYNCYDFAHLVWDWTQPTDVQCMNESAMLLHFAGTHV